MRNLISYKTSALKILSHYSHYLEYTDYDSLPTHSEAVRILSHLSECSHILKNLSHYYHVASAETLTTEISQTLTFCLIKKVKHYFNQVHVFHYAFENLKNILEFIGNEQDQQIISREIIALAEQLKNIQAIHELPGEALPEKIYRCEFRIKIIPSPDVFPTGLDMIKVLDEIRKLGKSDITPVLDRVPDLSALDPEKCYVGWNIHLGTDLDLNAVQDTLIFLEYDKGSTVEIETLREAKKMEEPAEIIETDETVDVQRITEESALETNKKETIPPKTIDTPQPEIGAESQTKPKLPPLVQKEETITTIRVAAEKLDVMVDLVGELVTAQSRLAQISGKLNVSELLTVSEEMEYLANDLRTQSMGLRMMPIEVLFKRFDRLVYDLSSELNKNVELSFEGEETELDKSVIEKLHNPLIHLVRNSLDHGIEDSAKRKELGKPVKGHIILSAYQAGSEVFIQIRDDGAGINLEKVRKKGLERGLIKETEQLTEKQILNLIFAPGFSTAENVSSVSGRGVGMDVVKSNVESLRGTVDIKSEEGKGTVITMKFPLTLAIIDGLLINVCGEVFILPLSIVEECLDFTQNGKENGSGKKIINLRGDAVPYIILRDFFELLRTSDTAEKIVVIRDENEGRIGLVVNSIIGQHQTVLKPLGSLYRDRSEFSGATILSDGSLALILDPARLVKKALEDKLLNHFVL